MNGPIKLKPNSVYFFPLTSVYVPVSNPNAELGLLTDFHKKFHTHSPSSIYPLSLPLIVPPFSTPLFYSFPSFPLLSLSFSVPHSTAPILPWSSHISLFCKWISSKYLCVLTRASLSLREKKNHTAVKRITFSSQFRILGLEVSLEIKYFEILSHGQLVMKPWAAFKSWALPQ